MGQLTISDLDSFRTNREDAIEIIKHYASQYKGAPHYDELGASCATSISKTLNTIVYSSEKLLGNFVIADEVNIDQVVDWFIENKDYDCNRHTAAFYMANCLKRKVNEFYRDIRNGSYSGSLAICTTKETLKEHQRLFKLRATQEIRQIRLDKILK